MATFASQHFRNSLFVFCVSLASAPAYASASEEGSSVAKKATFQQNLYEVIVNGVSYDDPVVLLDDDLGHLYASENVLQSWRIGRRPASSVIENGIAYYRLNGLPSARLQRDMQNLIVRLDVAPEVFGGSQIGVENSSLAPLTASKSGAALNYDLNVEWSDDRLSVNGFTEGSIFTSAGLLTTSAIFSSGRGPERFTRLDTAWTSYNADQMTELRLGDSISAAALGTNPVRFAGIQFSRNFATRPDFSTIALPSFKGTAALPSSVDLLVDGARRSLGEIAPGPFELSQIPVPTGGGRVEVVLTDLLGRQVRTDFDYFTSPSLLSAGLYDFSFELGFLRENFGSSSNDYSSAVALTTQRFGVTNGVTVEAHAELTEDVQMAGAGIALAIPAGGLFSAAVSSSQSDAGWGGEVSAAVERRGQYFSFGARAEFRTDNFNLIDIPDDFESPDLTVSGFADLQMGSISASASLLHRSFENMPSENIVTANVNMQLGDFGYASLFAQRIETGKSQTIFGGHLTIPLGPRRSVSATGEYGHTRSRAQINYQQSVPSGLGTGVQAAVDINDNVGGRIAITQNTNVATVVAEAASQSGSTGARFGARGSLGVIAGHAFAAKTVGSSFALVETVPDVKIYADNQLMGTTSGNGRLFLPNLRSFEHNTVSIDESDLPLEMVPQVLTKVVRPNAGGAVISFPVSAENGALVRLRLPDGSLIPVGAMITSPGRDDVIPVVQDGQAYVTGLATSARNFWVRWDNQSCQIALALPKNTEIQPIISGVCQPMVMASTDTSHEIAALDKKQ